MTQMRLSIASLNLVSVIRLMVPVIISRNPSESNLSPSRALICVEQMVMATADVKPLNVGNEMKLTRNPVELNLTSKYQVFIKIEFVS